MSDTNEALRRLLAQIDAGTDVLVGGTPGQARQLFAEAGAALAGRATIVSVASPIGELSLSTLIAQVSGRLDFDEQDDAVLELGFKRLKGDGQTVLVMLAPAGISRSALRYVQHVARQSPQLALVVHATPPLASSLEEPGLATLRARLHASPVIEFDAPAEAMDVRSVAVLPALPAEVSSVPPPAPATYKPRRPMLWAASALGVVLVGALIWLGQQAPGTAVAGSRTAPIDRPLVPASVPLPVLAGFGNPFVAEAPLPVPAVVSVPSLAPPASTTLARPMQIALATLPAYPPSMPSVHPEIAGAGLVRPPDPARRDPARLARARPSWPTPRYREPTQYPAQYEAARPWDGVSPIWVRRNPYRRDSPYVGTYAVDPNGVRVFQYDP